MKNVGRRHPCAGRVAANSFGACSTTRYLAWLASEANATGEGGGEAQAKDWNGKERWEDLEYTWGGVIGISLNAAHFFGELEDKLFRP
ncbi:MAG: hypothetical protein WA005_06160 [Candidatus Binataceae bacterium]